MIAWQCRKMMPYVDGRVYALMQGDLLTTATAYVLAAASTAASVDVW